MGEAARANLIDLLIDDGNGPHRFICHRVWQWENRGSIMVELSLKYLSPTGLILSLSITNTYNNNNPPYIKQLLSSIWISETIQLCLHSKSYLDMMII